MPQEVANILYAALATIVTSLIGIAFFYLRSWLSKKTKNQEQAKLLNKALTIVENSVKRIFQTFVEALKKEGKFDKKAQREAKEAAIKEVKTNLTPELVTFITENYGDLQAWISEQIEVAIYNCKQ